MSNQSSEKLADDYDDDDHHHHCHHHHEPIGASGANKMKPKHEPLVCTEISNLPVAAAAY